MKSRYWFAAIVLMLVGCSYLFYYFYELERTRKIEEIVSHQKIHAKLAARSFHELFGKWNGVLSYLSKDQNIVVMNEGGRHELDRLLRILKDEIRGITRADKTGRITYTVPYYPNSIGADISKQKHMTKILLDHKPIVSDVFNAVQGFQAIVVHYPVFRDGHFDGTIAFLLDFGQIVKGILDEIKIGNSGHAWMLSSEGVELYCPVPGHVGKSIRETGQGFPGLLSIADSMLSGKEGVATYVDDELRNRSRYAGRIAYYLPITIDNTFWSLAVIYSEEEITASVTDFRNKLAVVFASILLGGICFSYFGIKGWIALRETEACKVAEKALLESIERYKYLTNISPVGIFHTDADGHTTFVNPKWSQISGLSFEEALGDGWLRAVHPDDRKALSEGWQEASRVHRASYSDYRFLRSDGSVAWVMGQAIPETNSENQVVGYIGTITDITERKQAEENLKSLNVELENRVAERTAKLETSYSDLESFSYSVSHDLRAPLRAISGFAEIIARRHRSHLNPEGQHYIDNIVQASGHMGHLIDDLLTYSRLGRRSVGHTLVSLQDLLNRIEKNFAQQVQETGAVLEMPADVPSVIGDRSLLDQILTNLIQNALVYHKPGVPAHVTVAWRLQGSAIILSVSDNGIGIPEEYQGKIFDIFQRLHSDDEYPGTGIGLATVRKGADLLGGKVWVESIVGRGSSFFVQIPKE